MAWMPGSLAAGRPFGIKVLSVVENPGELGVDSHQGGVMIFDPNTADWQRPVIILAPPSVWP